MQQLPQVNSWKVIFSDERDPYLINEGTIVATQKEIADIPANTMLEVKNVVSVGYGMAVAVEFNSNSYLINPKDLRYIAVPRY